ncbi:MAG: hypothetical protein NZ823_10630 [Blastocatellia bacterium]|nr:hypothetical protein [Blastocatellia bacterium]
MTALQSYSRFTSTNPNLDFSFLYPSDWAVREVQGKEYDEVFIRGPRNEEDTYNLSIIVRVIPANSKLDTLVMNYVERNKHFSNFREISRATGSLADTEAAEIEVGYTIPLPINSVNAKETLVIERIIFLEHGDRLYEIAYKGVARDYHRYLEAFRNVARTFEFSEPDEQQAYRSMVISTPSYAVRERPADYNSGEHKS